MVDALRPSVPLVKLLERLVRHARERRRSHLAAGKVTAERLPPLAHVLDFDRVLGRPVERRVLDLGIGNRDAEAGAERFQLLVVHLLLLVRDVLAFARFAESVALDRARQDDRRRALVLHRRLVGVVDLDRIVPAERQLLELIVGQVLDHLQQARIRAPEVLAHVGARLDAVLLILAVDDLPHALHEQPVAILGEQRIPLPAPQDFDHVPARAAEGRLELLNDLPVAADRPVEPLQVAVDDEDQIVELLARRQRDRAECLRFVRLAVAEKRPDLGVRLRHQPAILHVADESRVVDRHDRAEPHRDGRVFPEVRHQPRMRVGRETAAGSQLAAEISEMLLVDPPFEIGARVNAGGRMALEEDDVAVAFAVAAAEEMIERDFVERRRRGIGRNVPADAVFLLVCADDHGQRIPPHEALDAPLDVRDAGHRHLLVRRNRVDVRRIGGKRQLDAVLTGMDGQFAQQLGDFDRTAALEHIIKRVEPLARFGRIELGSVFGSWMSHYSILDHTSSRARITASTRK